MRVLWDVVMVLLWSCVSISEWIACWFCVIGAAAAVWIRQRMRLSILRDFPYRRVLEGCERDASLNPKCCARAAFDSFLINKTSKHRLNDATWWCFQSRQHQEDYLNLIMGSSKELERLLTTFFFVNFSSSNFFMVIIESFFYICKSYSKCIREKI